MKYRERFLWAFGIFFIDFLIFFMPVTAFLAAYVIFTRPPWFRNWILKVYEDE
jgi:hypothetical protein